MSKIASFAGTVPENYDKYLGPVLFEPYALDLAARVSNPVNVLEIACGTGRLTKHLLDKLPVNGTLTATDLNADMMEIAKQVISDKRIAWQVVNAQELSYEDDSFDHVICQFGVMFFPDKAKAMAEAYRVLKPGGRYIFNVWDSLDVNPRSKLIKTVMDDIMGDAAPDFLKNGPYSWYDQHEITHLLKLSGFTNIQLEVVYKTAYYETADDLMKGFVTGSPLSAYLAEQTEALKEQIIDALRNEIITTVGEKHIASPMQAIVCSAVK